MEVTCPNCGAINRGTGRFCARCGQALPKPEVGEGEAGERDQSSLELPWLQAVKDRAVLPTTGLDASKAEPQPGGQQEPTQQAGQAEEVKRGEEERPTEVETPQEPGVEAEKPQEPADAPPPTWVVSILEPAAAAPPTEGSYESEELAHIMPWVHGAPEAEEVQAEEAEEGEDEASAKTPGLPPWLGDVTVQETLQSVPQQQSTMGDLADFEVEGIEPFILPDEAVEEAAPATLPDFMRQVDMANAANRPQEATQPAPIEVEQRQVVAPLSSPELEELVAGAAVRQMPVRAPRPGSVETLASLLQPVAATEMHRTVALPGTGLLNEAANEARAARGGNRVARWFFPDGLIYLLILASLLAVVIIKPPFGQTNAPTSPGVAAFYGAIESVPTNKPVLVVYDWDAGKSAEMSVLATAVMQHIMQRGLSFVTVSTVPQGPGFAQEITDALKNDGASNYGYEYGTNYLVLGYLPGSEAALRTLVDNFKRALPLDYVNSRPIDSYQLTAGGALNKVEDFALIVDLAGSEADLRNWIEQIASRTNVPVVAAVPQGLEPTARPYLGVPGAKLTALVSGAAGAYAYVHEMEENGHSGGLLTRTVDLNTRLNAQSVAALLVGLIIAAAFVTKGARKILGRRG